MTENEKTLLVKLENESFETLTTRGRGAELEKYCSWIGSSKHGTAKEKAVRLLHWYDSKTYKVRLKKYGNLKLKIDLKPGLFHGQTVRNSISQHLWLKKIRPLILSKFNYKCSICGYKPEESERKHLHIHEVEEYDLENAICELKGLELICGSCHSFHHIGRTYGVSTKANMEKLINHFTKVNGIEEEHYQEYFRLLRCSWREQSINKLDTIINSNVRSGSNKKVIFRISCDMPYKEEVIDQLKKKSLYIEN